MSEEYIPSKRWQFADEERFMNLVKETLQGKPCWVQTVINSDDIQFRWADTDWEDLEKGTLMYEWAAKIKEIRQLKNELANAPFTERNHFLNALINLGVRRENVDMIVGDIQTRSGTWSDVLYKKLD